MALPPEHAYCRGLARFVDTTAESMKQASNDLPARDKQLLIVIVGPD